MRENSILWSGSRLYGSLTSAFLRPSTKSSARSYLFLFSLLLLLLLVGAFLSTRLLKSSAQYSRPLSLTAKRPSLETSEEEPRKRTEIPLNCSAFNLTRTCNPTNFEDGDHGRSLSSPTCPDYFRWIHEDLRPWARTGITREMVGRAKRTANFKLLIVNGRVYIEKYKRAFQTRDIYTLWGILQLLRRYPGKIPDLELMFDCVDWPVIKAEDYLKPNGSAPPPLFRYCADDETLDIVFPDWSFWGWPEINIKPWESLTKDLKEGNNKMNWMEREPYAYWKGNPAVAATRQDLLRCNVSEEQDWNARVYAQDWIRESQDGYKKSDLGSQCIHRYKIYIEGSAWSVSEKYILACNSVTFVVKPRYYDFFTRSLMPVHHYWPIKEDDKCRSIKFAVDWSNSHKRKAQEIGRVASEFMQEELKMEYVYDYMFHLLNQYSKLLRFKPMVPRKAVEVCAESMACQARGLEKMFMMESLVKVPAESGPCTMPPPFDPASLSGFLRKKENSIKQVELWEKKYWDSQIPH